MSSTIDVYAVPLETLKRAIASQDAPLIAAIADRQAGLLKNIDQMNDEAELTCLDALKHLINGEDPNEEYGYLYGYALKALCAQLGAELSNICGISGASDWIENVDAVLAEHKARVSLSGLVYGGSPIEIPQPDDYPFIGSWPVPEMAAGLSVIERIDKKSLDPEMAETLKQLQDWLTTALELGAPIVGFLS